MNYDVSICCKDLSKGNLFDNYIEQRSYLAQLLSIIFYRMKVVFYIEM